MKGNNDLVLNHATVIEALQEYLDKQMGTYAPQVVCIIPKSDNTVIVSVSEKGWTAGEIMAREG